MFRSCFAFLCAPLLLAQSDTDKCKDVPAHLFLKAALTAVVSQGTNGGLGFHMWATVVNRDGEVCAVAFSGKDRGAQWPGSRLISAQKANTANAFSLPAFALSTANLHSATQNGGALYGLPTSNPVNSDLAYSGEAIYFGQSNDPMMGKRIGGVNVFGGGLALYRSDGTLVGGVGVSGDTACADHIIAWRLRDRLSLDFVPAGPAGAGRDNMIHDLNGTGASPSGFGHPVCAIGAAAIADNLPSSNPLGTVQP